MRIFGERLKEVRQEHGLTIFQVSKQVGISDACISRWENDINDPKCEQIVMLAKFFNVSTDYLLGLED